MLRSRARRRSKGCQRWRHALQAVAPATTPIRIAGNKVHADPVEILRNAVHHSHGLRRIHCGLAAILLFERALERHAAGECVIQRHADAVPVAELGRAGAGDVLRRHVRRRARDAGTRFRGLRSRFRDQPKVQDDDAEFRRDEDVGRFDVAMESSVTVERGQAVGDLAEDIAYAGKSHG